MLRKSFTLINGSNEYIRGDLRYREDSRNVPAVIICHGFKGFKDWGFFPLLGETLAKAGYATITFNFSRNGIGSDLVSFTELDQFAANTCSHELADLDTVYSAVKNGELGNGIIDNENIALMGHSRGGGIALLFAAKHPELTTLVTWSAIATVNRYSDTELDEWKKRGFIEIENRRTKQLMRINRHFIEDLEKNKDRLDILKAASNIEVPTMIVHGENDESVPSGEADQIYENLSSPEKQLEIIENGSHTFNTTHPMDSRPPQFEIAMDITESWFDKYLNM